MFNTTVNNRAKEIKPVLGDRVKDINAFIQSQVSAKHGRMKIVKALSEKYNLSMVDAAATWVAWQTYTL